MPAPSGHFSLNLRCRQEACERIAAGDTAEQAAPHCKDPARSPDASTVRLLKALENYYKPALASFQELMLPCPALPMGRHCMKSSHLLVRAGLTPLQALQTGTSVPAAAFRLPDRGLIRDGMRADLVLRPNHRDSRYAEHHRSLEARHSLSETSARVVGNFVQCWRQIESPLTER
jgi:hypothetical protein